MVSFIGSLFLIYLFHSLNALGAQSYRTAPYVIVSWIENNDVFIFLRCQTESKTIVKENILQNFCFQELQDGTGMDYAR